MKKRTKLGLIMGLAYLIDRISYPDKYKKKEAELTMELKYTPSDIKYEKIIFETPKNASCPYCGYKFEEMPKRKRDCPSCKKLIIRRKNFELKTIELITVEQYEKESEENNKEYFNSTLDDMKERLLRYKESSCSGVKISTSCDERVCPACAKNQGKFYTIAEALRDMPIPNKDCASGYCRCCYIPEI